ncbi:MAG: CDP-diacylglycerol--serine O-phosphatidyltransferase [Verrucomicrobia bacterium]|nr:CDP-diacylglycerol--serine O-phosphatidyltransferase [Verrucomicrobiota bacterium]
MARQRDPDEPKIYFLPNLMTAGNLACGFFAVLMIFKGLIEVRLEAQKMPSGTQLPVKECYEISRHYYEYAILLIFGSCLFDLLDGRLARLGGHDSPFGREFDSLADIVSFGMAPAMLVSKAVLLPLGDVGWGIAFVYLLCGAMRLARFNCLAALPKKPGASTDFRGIPIPMAAGFIASLTFLIIQIYENDRELGLWKYALAGAMLGLSWLMISNVRYPSFKKVGWRTRGTLGALVVAALILVMAVKYNYITPVVVFSSYLIYGLIRPWVSQTWRKGIEVDAEPEDDPPLPLPAENDTLPSETTAPDRD